MATTKETTQHHSTAKAPRSTTHKVSGAPRYTEAVGRRKTAIARVRIMPGTGKMTVNEKDIKTYFASARLVAAARAPFEQLKIADMDASVHISGGGLHSQAEAIRLGLSRAIVLKDAEWKPRLRTIGFMTRDSRMVERKKYGKKKARRSPQWAKR
ncbi:MAG TPA: 30S ribosomal protein S9 [Candidatus Paceibacterota bacterium]|nr:30S ribosomal protein S9 [Candidatus Paceibacterota bacterium]